MDSLCGASDYSCLTYILPHFPDCPDLVFGHLGGAKVSVPDELANPEIIGEIIPAPDYGEWIVVLIEDNR